MFRKFKCKTSNKWPEIKDNIIEEIKFAVQVNGKTRDIITVKKNTDQKQINEIVTKIQK